jgi:superfamily I DNA/RNA helicase
VKIEYVEEMKPEKKKTFDPTPEQNLIVEHYLSGESCKIIAYAGTGKTSTLGLCAEADQTKKVCYLCFDALSAERARLSMPKNVDARTFHSLCRQCLKQYYRETYGPEVEANMEKRLSKDGPKYSNRDIANHLVITEPMKLEEIKTSYRSDDTGEKSNEKIFSPAKQVGLIKKAVALFCNSISEEIEARHFETVLVSPELLQYAKTYWSEITRLDGVLPWTHDYYAKIWCLLRPSISSKYDVLFIDEAQDTNPLQAQFYRNQNMQKIYVGDSHQAIYQFRGDVDELNRVPIPTTLNLTYSFRFGKTISDAAVMVFKAAQDKTIPLVGAGKNHGLVKDYILNPDALLMRKNSTCLYLLFYEKDMYAPKKFWFNAKFKKKLLRTLHSLKWFIDNPTGEGPMPDYMDDDLSDYENLQEIYTAIALKEESPYVAGCLELIRTTKNYQDLVDYVSSFGGSKRKDSFYVDVMTVHRSKGGEWPRVQLADDFRMPGYDEYSTSNIPEYYPPEEELNLLYVAITRAQEELGLGSSAWIYGRRVEPKIVEPKQH